LSKDLTKKAVDMLLRGATLLAEPCPYCKGVRVMKDGYALCVDCGKVPQDIGNKISETSLVDDSHITNNQTNNKINNAPEISSSTISTLEKKLAKLSNELDKESDPTRQQLIMKSINDLLNILEKLKK